MIDFVSTREGMDVQSARCARLLAAVIAQAIKDAAHPPNDTERKARGNSGHAYRAIKFLFESDGPMDVYANLIGTSGDEIRRALLSDERLLPHSSFKAEDRRTIKTRHIWSLTNSKPVSLPRRYADEQQADS